VLQRKRKKKGGTGPVNGENSFSTLRCGRKRKKEDRFGISLTPHEKGIKGGRGRGEDAGFRHPNLLVGQRGGEEKKGERVAQDWG